MILGGFRYVCHARIKIILVSTAFHTVPPNEHIKVQEILVFRDMVGDRVVAEMLNRLLRISEMAFKRSRRLIRKCINGVISRTPRISSAPHILGVRLITPKREQGDARHRTELQSLHVQLGDLRPQVGVLEGNLASVQVAHTRDADELARTREQLSMSRASADTRRQTPPTKPVVKRKVPRTPRS
jgi:hypothetical protein